MRICEVPDCIRVHKSKGYCASHYAKWRKETGQLPAPTKFCSIEGCEAKHQGKGYCRKHYTRFVRHGDPNKLLQREFGTGNITHDGYMLVVHKGRKMMQHRVVMQEHIGRDLLPEETVHHMNGDKLDNRLENLELWSSRHPGGQRVQDKIDFAIDFLATYGYSVIPPQP